MNEITQDAWIESIIFSWQKAENIAYLLAHASDNLIARELKMLKRSDWREMHGYAEKLYPPLQEHYHGIGDVRGWLASNCMRASNALFDGKPDLARKILKSKKDYGMGSYKKAIMNDFKKEGAKPDEMRGLKLISNKQLNSEPSNWKKCK